MAITWHVGSDWSLLCVQARLCGLWNTVSFSSTEDSHTTIYTDILIRYIAWAGFELTTLVVIGTDCICSYKFNYHTITSTTTFVIFIHVQLRSYIFQGTWLDFFCQEWNVPGFLCWCCFCFCFLWWGQGLLFPR